MDKEAVSNMASANPSHTHTHYSNPMCVADIICRCDGICTQYPHYTVEYSGIGQPPSVSGNDVGYCSQMATFTRIRRLSKLYSVYRYSLCVCVWVKLMFLHIRYLPER